MPKYFFAIDSLIITVKGSDKIVSNLGNVNKSLDSAYERVLRGLMETFSNKWQLYAPVDTGALRRSGIKGNNGNVYRKNSKLSLEFGSDLPYAVVQEFMDYFAHPKGGQAHYAQRSLTETRSDSLRLGFNALRGIFR